MSTISGISGMQNWMSRYVSTAGVKSNDSKPRARAIRISNLIGLSAIFNTLVFGLLFWIVGDHTLFGTCIWVTLVYVACHLLNVLGTSTLGRVSLLLSGNLIVLYFACLFRGEALIQLLFYSLAISPFMFFSWEERKYYLFGGLSVILLAVGEFNQWGFFEAHPLQYDLRIVRVFAVVAPLHQIIMGFYYFLKQSVKFEAESNENLRKLEFEHRKQMQIQKMSSLGEMAAGVSHEINNPLMVILGKTYNLKRDLAKKLPPEDPNFSNLEKIDSMVHRISKIIRALRNFSRNSDNDPSEKTELKSILDSTLDLCQERFASSGIELEVKAEDDIMIYCRPTEISQVILNLLNNAYDASSMKEGSRVKILARKLENQVEIVVEDNGMGINPSISDKIMQPFFTTKEVGKGTGLGLSVSKGLIESHHGTLSYIPGKTHTTFQILLPALLD